MSQGPDQVLIPASLKRDQNLSRLGQAHQRTQQRLRQQREQFGVRGDDTINPFPLEFDGRFAGSQIAILGDGDWYNGWNAVEYRLNRLADPGGLNRTIFDPKYLKDGTVSEQAIRQAGRDPERIGKVVAAPALFPPESKAFVLSPSRFHVGSLEELGDNDNVKSIYVDKPIAIDSAQLRQLDEIMPKLDKPVFFGDHYVYAATGLLALLGKETVHKGLLDLRYDPTGELRAALDQAQPLLGRLAKVEARTTFMGSQSLVGDRGWLEKSSLGGGVLLDLAVHQTNVLHCLGLEVETIERADRRIRPENPSTPLGVFVPRPVGSDLAEDYADVSGRLRGGAALSIRVAQFEKQYEDFLVLTDENGRTVKLDYVTRAVQVFQGDDLIGELRCSADPVLLTMHHALSYFASGDTEPMYYQEQRDSVELIERIKGVSDQQSSGHGDTSLATSSSPSARISDVSRTGRLVGFTAEGGDGRPEPREFMRNSLLSPGLGKLSARSIL